MAYISSAYIVMWTIFHLKLTRNFLLFVPLLVASIDWIKQGIFLLKKKSFSPWGIRKNLISTKILLIFFSSLLDISSSNYSRRFILSLCLAKFTPRPCFTDPTSDKTCRYERRANILFYEISSLQLDLCLHVDGK